MGIVAVLIISFVAFYMVFNVIIEPAYVFFYNRPLYVHLYIFPKKVEDIHKYILRNEFSFYKNLSGIKKRYFEHRVRSFVENYQFVGREGLEVTEDMKVRIAAIWVQLTFGMRNYLAEVFTTILIYPDIFNSVINEEYHKGEFNPSAGVVVFSWKHFMEGIKYDNDNLNLGLHEFAHVLHFNSAGKRRAGTSEIVYCDMFTKIMEYATNPNNAAKLRDSQYFREYAFTNRFEFIAVVLEHFFETPKLFRQNFPELHEMVGKMINQRGA